MDKKKAGQEYYLLCPNCTTPLIQMEEGKYMGESDYYYWCTQCDIKYYLVAESYLDKLRDD